MKNSDILTILNEISNLLDREEYQEASEYIARKKSEINSEVDVSSEYIDKLMKKLK